MVTHTTTDASSAVSGFERRAMSSTLGVKLVHTSPVSLKEERILRQTMQKAERKFHLGYVIKAHYRLPYALIRLTVNVLL
jgi:hypothetical protein